MPSEEQAAADNKTFLAALDRRFPLARELQFFTDDCGSRERLPGVIGLLAAMTSPDLDGDVCVALPSRERVAALTAVLVALQAAHDRFNDLRKAYLEQGFEDGELVRVLPSRHVFEFGGVFAQEYGEFFRLRFLDDETAVRSFPIRDAALLEKTTSRRPKGKGSTPLESFQPSPLDRLIRIESGGNRALLANEVLLVTTQREFIEFLEDVRVCRADQPDESWRLREVLSWGSVQSDGSLAFRDGEVGAGAPLIAVSHRTEFVAEAVRAGGDMMSRVIVDGAVRVGDLQALDELVDNSKLLIVADHTRLDEFREIADRGCRVWKLPDGLISLMGSDQGVMRELRRAYEVAAEFDFLIERCDSAPCDEIARLLEQAQNCLKAADAGEDDQRLLSLAYARLLDLSAVVHIAGSWEVEELTRALQSIMSQLDARQLFMDHDARTFLQQALALMRQVLEPGRAEFRQDKQTKLLHRVRILRSQGRRVVVLAPTIFAADSARRFLDEQLAVEVEVLTLQSVRPGTRYDDLVLTGWPRKRHLQRLLNCYAAPHLHALAYDFEYGWFSRLHWRRAKALASWETHTGSLVELTGVREKFCSVPRALPTSAPESGPGINEAALDGIRKGSAALEVAPQEAREGRYVSFAGNGYAYITQSHRLPKLTALINGTVTTGTDIPLVTLDQLDVGDYVLFRAADDSQRDLIRTIAERQMGAKKYGRFRDTAERWKEPLRRLGDSAETVWRVLGIHGGERTQQAIHTWLTDPAQIGPQQKGDIEIIARAARDRALERDLTSVWQAIRRVRGAHTAAGSHLSDLLVRYLPGQMPDIDDEEMTVNLVLGDLPLGRVLILQIDAIGKKAETRPYWEVNRVLWQA